MTRYRKRPILVEAFPYDGPGEEFAAWLRIHVDPYGGIEPGGVNNEPWQEPDWPLRLLTIQGEWVTCRVGEVIIAEAIRGRFYPCAGTTFDETYEPAEAGEPALNLAWRSLGRPVE